MNRRMVAFRLMAAVCLALVSGCAAFSAATPEVPVRLAVLPILDALPMYAAEEQGCFEEEGVEVRFIPVSSAAERDQVMAAGQADGMINELVSTVLYNQNGVQIQVVRFARVASAEDPQYRILAAPESGVDSAADLAEVEIGISEGTVIEYITDRLLQAEGVSMEAIQTISVPRIPDRMALLTEGELQAATLPDPLSSLAIQNGARVVLDDTRHPEFGYSVISFRAEYLESNPESVRAFLRGLECGVESVNESPEEWTGLLVERQLVPEPVLGAYEVPSFPAATIPSQAQFDDVVAWFDEKGMEPGQATYANSVTAEYLP